MSHRQTAQFFATPCIHAVYGGPAWFELAEAAGIESTSLENKKAVINLAFLSQNSPKTTQLMTAL
ncbi:hypothetical protein [Paraherbaspirillum soli]|uniref:Uncharacterized protein n=1 Tax=Paraherbaspirillum soli TaxID=631222 RepID=A0ABW0M4L3_9BURK